MRKKTTKKKIDPSSLTADQAIRLIEQKAKEEGMEGAVCRATHYHNPYDLRRPSGVPQLDLATAGGLPAGGLSQICGPDSTGKNFLMYRYMANVQKMYGDKAAVAVACFEPTTDKKFARLAGVQIAFDDYEIALEQKLRKERGLKPFTAKDIKAMQTQLGEFVILRGLSEVTLDNLLFLLGTNKFQVIGIDSWDALLPPPDQCKTLKDPQKVADGPMLETRFMRKFWAILNKKDSESNENETCVIGIRQVRANMSGYGADFKTVGSYAIRHGKLMDIALTGKARVQDKDGNLTGKYISWKIVKAKAGCHEGPSGEFVYNFEPPSIDDTLDLVNAGVMYGVIERSGSWYKYKDIKRQGEQSMKMTIIEKGLWDEIWNAIKAASNLNFRWK